jgi:flagellar M-ring protein FliF
MSGTTESTLAAKLPSWTRIPPQQLLALLLVVATAIALVVGGWMWSTQPDYKVLFSNLSDRDGGAVIAALQQMNVPYKYAEGGGALLVPSDKVHDLRLKLAGQGLPKGSLVGFELMEGQRFGSSQFLEQVNYQRGLEGELARSIMSLQAVAGARVHLALARGTAFLREQAKPSASILVQLHPGRSLDPMQVASIVHLVSNSVPELSPKNVTVVDQNGTLLSADQNGAAPGSVDTKQLKYRQETEQSYIKRIEEILAPVYGAHNVRAQVSAELDFTEVEQAEEMYKPNQKPDEAAIRSSQTSEQTGPSTGNSGQGVPGALTNQPPNTGGAPVEGQPGAQTGAAPTAAPTGNQRKESAVNYEVDKSIRHTKVAQGRLKRLSVAVVVNNKTVTDPKGKTTQQALSDIEKQQITDLVKGVMGFDKDRGDQLSVINSAFTTPEAEKVVDLPLWKDPQNIAMAKEAGKYLLFAAVIGFVLLRLRPMAKNLAKPPQLPGPAGELLPAVEPGSGGATGVAVAELEAVPDRYQTSLQNAREIARQDPRIVANVVKEWVNSNEQ